jgi:hypothetical protein
VAHDGRLVAPRPRHTAILVILLLQGEIERQFLNPKSAYNWAIIGRSRVRESRYIQTGSTPKRGLKRTR